MTDLPDIAHKRIARVFPSQTRGTPDDELAFFDGPPLWPVGCDEVHVSCTFTWDKPRAEWLRRQWSKAGYKVKLGGPAYDDPGGEFVPGRYLKPGNVMTSRGCNGNCWFCVVPKREGDIRELPICEGNNIIDSNLLQCSANHIRSVFAMLKRQPEKARFTGGFEAKILEDWHCELLADLKPANMFFAYDEDEDWGSLREAAGKLKKAGMRIDRQKMFVYVLIGYPKDDMTFAVRRLQRVKRLGMCPFAMLYENDDPEWKTVQRNWSRPALIYSKVNK